MAFKRDHQFPSTSIGRSQGARGLHQVDSHDSLAAHPLLTSNRSSSPLSDQPTNGLPRYVPYTPRQRVTPTAATASPQQQQGDAMSKLQFINMKAAAQNLGLDTGSIGWAILEKLISEADVQAPEWAEIWAIVTSGKATLLLPLEEASSNQPILPEFVKDHIIFYDGPVWKNTRIVTLSGLRGILDNDTLTFRSSIPPSSRLFQDIVDPITRTAALSRLPDLPLPLSSSPQSSSYPTFTLPSHTSSLPIPPRAPHSLPARPQLPPRPYRAVSAPITTVTPSPTPPPSSRLPNPFAGLFGSSSNSSTPKASSVSTFISPSSVPALASPIPSPSASVLSVDSNAQANQPDYTVIEVSAFTISRKIVRNDVGKEMNKALRHEVQDSLTGVPLPTWVIDCVHQFTSQWYPVRNIEPALGFEPGKKTGASSTAKGLDGGGSDTCVINRVAEKPEDVAVRMQDFYLGLEQDVRIRGPSFWEVGEGHEKASDDDEQGENEDEKRVREKINSETRIKEVMEVVERTICSLFYDRLYLQPMSDDASHDDTLSSRVAALNMLDLGLEHLDIHVGKAGPKLDLVVRACGETLTQLDACRCPGDKAAVLVAAHKILVDGLSHLPPIRLMSDEESKAQKAKASSAIEESKVDAPPRDMEGKLRIMTPMVPHTHSQALEVQLPETGSEIRVRIEGEGEGELKTVRRTSLVPIVTEPASGQPPLEPGSGSDVYTSEPRPSGLPPSSPVASPVTEMSPLPTETTPISGDVLLPMIIFSVVKTNPLRLVSNLLYTQRFRNHAVGGEESYCLINLMAVAEFLENVDLAALGLGDSDKVMSAADLTPIPLDRSPRAPEIARMAADGMPGSLRGRVEQANRVLTDVVDSSFGMLRSLLPHSNPNNPSATSTSLSVDRTGNTVKPGFGLLRRESGFSIKSITAALPMPMGRGTKSGEETGQQLMTVSKPGSFQSSREEDESGVEESEDDEGEDEDEEDEEDDVDESGASAFGDTRSIRSFESMLSGKGMTKKPKKSGGTRKSLSDRLAHMSGLSGLKGSPQAAALMPQPHSPASSMRPRLKPPIQRFLDCTPDDLRLGEVGELLRDYRRLVEGMRAVGGFEA